MAMGVTVSSWQSMRSAWPATPAADASWSMIPQGTPDARCSAIWVSCASSSVEPSNPSARATETSSAALDDKPAPTGRVVVISPTNPLVGCSSATTPATYRAQAGVDLGGVGDPKREVGRLGLIGGGEHDPVAASDPRDGGRQVDGQREHQPAAEVGVLADEVDPPGADRRDRARCVATAHSGTARRLAAASSGGTGLR